MTIKLSGVELRPLLSLSNILAGYESCLVHIKAYFTSSPSSNIFYESLAHFLGPYCPHIVELA